MNTSQPNSQFTNPSDTRAVEATTLLDLVLTIVDNLRLLIVVPLLAGLVVYTIASIWPKTYESTAILKADKIVVSLMNSASVLDPIARSLASALQRPIDDAHRKLKSQVQARFNSKEKFITLTVQAESPQAAQALASTVLQQTYVQSRSRDSEQIRLYKQLEQAKVREKEASDAAKLLSKKIESLVTVGVPEVAQGYAQMMRMVQESQAQQSSIEQELIGVDASAIVQESTLPYRHT